jgi:hypothetical protein
MIRSIHAAAREWYRTELLHTGERYRVTTSDRAQKETLRLACGIAVMTGNLFMRRLRCLFGPDRRNADHSRDLSATGANRAFISDQAYSFDVVAQIMIAALYPVGMLLLHC